MALRTSIIRRMLCSWPSVRFNDHRMVFRHKSNWELLRALLVLRVCGSDVIADNALKIFSVGHLLLGERILGWVLRPTVYAQFVAKTEAGKEDEGLRTVAESLKDIGLHLMVAPTLEGDIGQGGTDDCYKRNLQELLHLSELAWEFGREQRNPCLQVKATALLSADILRYVAKVFEEATISNKIKMVELVAERAITPSSSADSWKSFPGVSQEIAEAFYKGARRLGILSQAAKSKNLHLLVDAEFTYINPAVSLLALAAMTVINKEKPVVCHTLQCYLQNAVHNLKREIQITSALKSCFGVKIVRGAYLEQERRIAKSCNPICASHAETGQNYKRVITHCMEHAAQSPRGNCFIVVATHNEEGICHALDSMHSFGLRKKDGPIAFAQIYGMAEQISVPLAKEGYTVYKSVPVGKLSQVLPYLARRAAENRSVLLGARKEREMLQKELIWRLKSLFLKKDM